MQVRMDGGGVKIPIKYEGKVSIGFSHNKRAVTSQLVDFLQSDFGFGILMENRS